MAFDDTPGPSSPLRFPPSGERDAELAITHTSHEPMVPDRSPQVMALPGWVRGMVAGIAGGIAWRLGLRLIFGPAQSLLADPSRQSAKMLGVFAPGPDAPRMYADPSIVWIALIAIGIVWGWWYVWLSRPWRVSWWVRGLCFGGLVWTLMVPWFEFYLPWNVLREPATLVALELACWAGVMVTVGCTIAGVDAALAGVAKRPASATI